MSALIIDTSIHGYSVHYTLGISTWQGEVVSGPPSSSFDAVMTLFDSSQLSGNASLDQSLNGGTLQPQWQWRQVTYQATASIELLVFQMRYGAIHLDDVSVEDITLIPQQAVIAVEQYCTCPEDRVNCGYPSLGLDHINGQGNSFMGSSQFTSNPMCEQRVWQLLFDKNNCGACGHRCGVFDECTGGVCVPPVSCPAENLLINPSFEYPSAGALNYSVADVYSTYVAGSVEQEEGLIGWSVLTGDPASDQAALVFSIYPVVGGVTPTPAFYPGAQDHPYRAPVAAQYITDKLGTIAPFGGNEYSSVDGQQSLMLSADSGAYNHIAQLITAENNNWHVGHTYDLSWYEGPTRLNDTAHANAYVSYSVYICNAAVPNDLSTADSRMAFLDAYACKMIWDYTWATASNQYWPWNAPPLQPSPWVQRTATVTASSPQQSLLFLLKDNGVYPTHQVLFIDYVSLTDQTPDSDPSTCACPTGYVTCPIDQPGVYCQFPAEQFKTNTSNCGVCGMYIT
jgi:hypothetical protein